MEEKPTIRHRVKRFTINTLLDWGERNVGTYASSMVFFFILSVIPLLILLLQLLPHLGLTRFELLDFLFQLIPEVGYGLVAGIVSEAYRTSGSVVTFSALTLFWSAARGTMALRTSLNKIYDEKEQRSYPVLCLISLGYTAAIILAFAGMLFLIFAGPVSTYLAGAIPEIFNDPVTIELWDKVLLFLLMVIVFSLVYTFIPAGKRPFIRQIPGAVLLTVIWAVFTSLFSIYIKGYNTYTKFYGSLGVLALMIFWLYWCFYILLIGAFFNRLVGERWDRIAAAVRNKRAQKKLRREGDK